MHRNLKIVFLTISSILFGFFFSRSLVLQIIQLHVLLIVLVSKRLNKDLCKNVFFTNAQNRLYLRRLMMPKEERTSLMLL